MASPSFPPETVKPLSTQDKPIAQDRLAQALAKLNPIPEAPLEHFFVKDGDRCWFLQPGELTLLESEGNYTRLYFQQSGPARPLILKSLQSLEDRLPKDWTVARSSSPSSTRSRTSSRSTANR